MLPAAASVAAVEGFSCELPPVLHAVNKDKQRLYNILAKHTGQNVEKIIEDSQRDFWLDAEEALNYGCIDEIVKTK